MITWQDMIDWLRDAAPDREEDEAGRAALDVLCFIRENPYTTSTKLSSNKAEELIVLAYGSGDEPTD